MRLIDGDALEDALVNHGFCYCGENEYNDGIADGFLLARDDVKEAPTIDAEPIRYGEWIGKPMIGIGGYSRMRCSVCDNVFLDNKGKWNYCPCCGAKMDEDEISNIAKESADKISKALDKVRAKGMQKQNIKEDDKS